MVHEISIRTIMYGHLERKRTWDSLKKELNCKIGDTIIYKEYDSEQEIFTGRNVIVEITFIKEDSVFVSPGYLAIWFKIKEFKAN